MMKIVYQNGNEVEIRDEARAREVIETDYPEAVYGLWEKINDRRSRLLVWEDEANAEGDDGSRAIAEIVDEGGH